MGEKCFPSLGSVDAQVIEYWRQRMAEANHPLMRARYADLVWDLSKNATGQKPPIEAAQTAIDSYVQLPGLPFGEHTPFVLERVVRGMSLAVSISDQALITRMRDAVYAFGTKANDPQYWAMLFDTFGQFPKVELTEHQEEDLIRGLEKHVADVANR